MRDGCDMQINDLLPLMYCYLMIFSVVPELLSLKKNTLHRDLYFDLPLFICVSTLSFADPRSLRRQS